MLCGLLSYLLNFVITHHFFASKVCYLYIYIYSRLNFDNFTKNNLIKPIIMRKITVFLSALFVFIGIAAQAQTLPTLDGTTIYYIKNTRSGKYVQANDGSTFKQITDPNPVTAGYKFYDAGVEESQQVVKIQSVSTGKWLGEISGAFASDKASAKKWYLYFQEARNGYSICDKLGSDKWGAWNDEASTNITVYSANDNGSSFIFEEVPAYTNDKYTTLTAKYQAKIDAWEAIGTGTGIGAIDANKLITMENLIASTTSPTTWETYAEAEENFSKKITYGNAINLPTGYYSMKAGGGRTNAYLSASAGHYLVGLANANATRSIWYITNNEDGTCTIQNHLTKEYVQAPTSGAVMAAATPANLTIYTPFANKTGVVVFGTENTKIHQGNTDRSWSWIGGWQPMSYKDDDDGSNYTLVAIADPDAETIVAAETTKAVEEYASEYTSKYIAANQIANILGVSEIEIPELTVTTLNDYFNVNPKTFVPSIYAAAESNVYRFVHTNSKVLGVDGTPKVVDANENDFSQLWVIKSVEDGFKFVNLNKNAVSDGGTIAALGNADNAEDKANGVSFTNFTNGGLYKLANIDGENTFQITNAGKKLNVESGGLLDYWSGSNHRFTAVVVENIDITLADVDGNAWASAYLPFGVKNEGEAEVLVGSQVNESTVTMAEATDVAAKNGFVVKAAAGTQKATLKIDNSAATTSVIGGSTVATTIDDSNRNSIYVLGKGKTNNKIGFYNLAANGTVAANKAYITAEAAVNGFVFDGEATAIESVESNTNSDASIYDLSGRRVSKATKGIFIINGKKVIR